VQGRSHSPPAMAPGSSRHGAGGRIGAGTVRPCGGEFVGVPVQTSGGTVAYLITRRTMLEVMGGGIGASLFNQGHVTIPERLSTAERAALSQILSRNIETAWADFHIVDAGTMLAAAQAQLHLLNQNHTTLDP